jgi:hypothetical protein
MKRPGARLAIVLATLGAVALPGLLWLSLQVALTQPQTWAPLPGWTYQADGLSVAAAALGGLLAGVGLAATLPFLAVSPRRLRLRTVIGWGVLLLGLAQTAFAGALLGRWLGLEVAALGLVLLDWPEPRAVLGNTRSPFWRRFLAGVPLLALALTGLLDAARLPGEPVAALSAAVVGALLVPGVLRALYRPAPGTPAAAYALGVLYAPAACYPLLRSLAAGPWDPGARLLVAGTGLALLAWTALSLVAAARSANPPFIFRIPYLAFHLLGAVLLGLGVGAPAGVAGALALGAAGWAGGALAALAAAMPGGDGHALRLLGRLGVWGLPPFAGFAGLWLLAGALLPAGYGLGLALLLGIPALQLRNVDFGLRNLSAAAGDQGPEIRDQGPALTQHATRNTQHVSRFTFHVSRFIPLLPLAALLLLGGLAPAPWLDGAVRPALNALAAGVPALRAVEAVPGLGYRVGAGAPPIAAWPVLGLGAAFALAWLAVEVAARARRARSEEHAEREWSGRG